MRPIHALLITLLSPAALVAGAAAQSTTHTLPGPSEQSRMGHAVASLGDLDGDGCDDFAVGAPHYSWYAGQLTAHSGRDRRVLWTRYGAGTPAQLGCALAPLGDVDGDGKSDLLVGALGLSVPGGGNGRAYVLSGADGTEIHAFSSAPDGDNFGQAVAAAGDVNGDGITDLLVSDPWEDVTQLSGITLADAGAVYLFSGSDGAQLARVTGSSADDRFGTALCGALDLNGNGLLEFLVGSPQHGPNDEGRIDLFSAPGGMLVGTVAGYAGLNLGASMCALEDASGDGLMDVAVGAPGYANDGANAGVVLVLTTLSLGTGAQIVGDPGSRSGSSVASAGDVDRDGLTDVWVGAPNALPLLGAPGSVTLRSPDASAALAMLVGPGNGSELGRSIATPDTNGDGVLDLLAGQPGDDANGLESGSALIALMADAAGVADCFGASGCPCGASDPELHAGCPNSTGGAGKLVATGRARVGADTVVLRGSDMPNSTCLYFQGTARVNAGAGAPFGDGLRCAGGSVTRLGTRNNALGASSFPPAGTPGLAERGGAQPGDTLHYQVWYRDTAAFCTSATHNFTNAYSIAWES